MSTEDLQAQLDEARRYVRLLFPVYRTWWHEVGGLDPGDESANILIMFQDDESMNKVCEAVEPHEAAICAFLERDDESESVGQKTA